MVEFFALAFVNAHATSKSTDPQEQRGSIAFGLTLLCLPHSRQTSFTLADFGFGIVAVGLVCVSMQE
jgi:hypothetical protein